MFNKKQQIAYVLGCIESRDGEHLTNEGKIKYFFDCYESEFVCPSTCREYPNEVRRIAAYLQGLPFDFAFRYDDIAQLGLSWGFDLGDDAKREKFIESWFRRLAQLLLHLRRFGVSD